MRSCSARGGPRIRWPDAFAASAMVSGDAGAHPVGFDWDGSHPMAAKNRSIPAGAHTIRTSLGAVIRSA